MIKKEVKTYKRTKTSIGYRINLAKKDNFTDNQQVYILTTDEYKGLLEDLENAKIDQQKIRSEYDARIKDLQDTISKLNQDIQALNYNLLELNTENKEQLKEIALKQILITKLENRSFINRLLNRPVKLTNNEKTLINSKQIE